MDLSHLAVDNLIQTRTLTDLGLDAYGIRALGRAGKLKRCSHGWYAVAPVDGPVPWQGADHWESNRLWHLLRLKAHLRAFADRAAASHQSAVLLHGGRILHADLDVVHLERTRDDHSRRRSGAVIHPGGGHEYLTVTTSVEHPGGYLSVTPAMAAVQVGLIGHEQGHIRALESLVAAESLLWSGATTAAELAAAVEECARHPGILSVRHVLVGAESGSESAGETLMCLGLRRLGCGYRQQVEISGTSFRVDALLDDDSTILEFDGKGKYFLPRGHDAQVDPRAALAAEKARHDQLVRLGYGVGRVGWPMVWNLRSLAAEVEAARSRVRRRSA